MRNKMQGSRYLEACLEAIRAVAEAEKSDPFAVARLITHLRNGIEDDPKAVTKTARAVINQRREQIEAEFEKRRKLGILKLG
jgi:hypothetical protein